MKVLIIILIVVLIIQTAVFIYSNFIDLSAKRQSTDMQAVVKNQHQDFLNEKERYQFINAEQQELIKRISRQRDTLSAQLLLLKKAVGRTKDNPMFEQELTDQVADLVSDYMERGIEFDKPNSLDLDFSVNLDSKSYDIHLQVEERDNEKNDKLS